MRQADEVTAVWGEWIQGLRRWDLFGGVTYDPGKRPVERFWGGMVVPMVVSRDVAVAHVRRWARRSEGALGRRVNYVMALEYSREGWPHFHPLLEVGGLRGGEIRTLWRLWFPEHGGLRLEEPRDSLAVAAYAAKYLSKDLERGDVIFSPGLRAVESSLWSERGRQAEWVGNSRQRTW